jgi:hypothetical protein
MGLESEVKIAMESLDPAKTKVFLSLSKQATKGPR